MPEAALDEMVDGSGGLRAHWRGVLSSFTSLGGDGLTERVRRLERAFEEEGLSGLQPEAADAEATRHAWRCDPLPLPLPAAEFAALEAGLAQRARLLEALLADIYGPQTEVAAAGVPPGLILGHPGFLRACRFPGARPLLHFYAADLIRGPDGAWRVHTDRTGAAGGAGAVRDQRHLLARVFPEVFRPTAVRSLGPFFELWQEALRALAPDGREPPSVALLSPGPASPLWFEHMTLAHALGCTLVEDGDLTARGGVVFLKTLGGLRRVDVLLRRMDGRLIDPLELDATSPAGVPGLLDALRQGGVRIANDPGAGVLEAPGLAAFLPGLCRRLLGEEPLLPGVPALWLGAPRARAAFERAPAEAWNVRPACDAAAPVVELAALPPDASATLRARIAAAPQDWVAVEPVPPSVAPCLVGGRLVPRPVALRLFLVRDAAGWHAMPGGLARVLATPERGGPELAKDVWVLSGEAGETAATAAPAAPRLALRRTPGDLPSRVADNMFWLGRSVERLDGAARLSRLALARLVRLGTLPAHEMARLHTLGACLAEAGLVGAESGGAEGLGVALFAALGPRAPIGALLADVARLAEAVRDRLTGEMYGAVTASLRAAQADLAAVGRSYDGLTHGMAALGRFAALVAGLAAENMVRGGGWRFLELGRRVERAIGVAGEVGIALSVAPERVEASLRLVLELCDSALTYRSRYFDTLQPAPVLDLVLADPGNPRGLAFQLVQMQDQLEALEVHGPHGLARRAATLQEAAEALVGAVLEARDQSATAVALAGSVRGFGGEVEEIAVQITRRFFALLPAMRTVGWTEAAEAVA